MISLEKFGKDLDRDIAWRKKEFTNLEFLIQANKSEEQLLLTLYRAAIVLLYSHWEGHIKYCSTKYLEYICKEQKKCTDLNDNFSQIMIGKHLSDQKITSVMVNNIEHQKALFDFFSNRSSIEFIVNPKVTIDAESNLNFEILEKILMKLGLEKKLFETKENLIDERLLAARNSIAHGEKRNLTDVHELYRDIKAELLNMIELFHSLVEDSVLNQTYLIHKEEE